MDPLLKTAQVPEHREGNIAARTQHAASRNVLFLVAPDSRAGSVSTENLVQALHLGGFSVKTVHSINDAAAQDAVVMITTLAQMADAAATRLPLIILSTQNDFDTRLAAARSGARFVLHPDRPDDLLTAVRFIHETIEQRPYRILVVEDDVMQAEWVASVLQSSGMEVQTAGNPYAAFDLAGSWKPDLVMLDIHLPECSGTELAAIIRQQPEQARTPIVFLTSDTDISLRRSAMRTGAEDILFKPIDPESLVCAISVRLERARQLRAIEAHRVVAQRELENQRIAIDRHAIVSVTDIAGRILYVNDRFCEISGYARNDLIGRTHRVVNSGIHPKEFFAEMWRTISGGTVWQGEICNRARDGHIYWVESTIVPFLDEVGRPYQYVSIRTDITEIVRVKEDLRLARDRLAHVLDASPTVLYILDANDQNMPARWVSENLLRITGYTTEEAMQPGWWAANLHPDDRDQAFRAVASVVQANTVSHEYRFRLKNGSYRWITDTLRLVPDVDGKPAEIIGAWVDIQEIYSAREALRESEERLRYSQAFANIGTWDWNIQTGEIYWSERVAPLFGYPKENIETNYEKFLRVVHPDDRQSVIDAINACVERGAEYNIEHRVVWPDGTVRWIYERGDTTRDINGKPKRFLGVVQDITRRKLAEEEIIRAREEAERANQAKSHFLSSMSHELRTPMNAILGFAQLMEADTKNPLSDWQKEEVGQILKAGWHLLNLINEVLDFSRIDAGTIALSVEDVDLYEVMGDCRDLIQPLAAQYGVTLIDECRDSGERIVRADRTRLKQVILNLLSNAVKYNREAGSVTVQCSVPSPGRLRISVADTGRGLDDRQLAQLFVPFNRLGRERENIDGTGIGLVIARRLIEMMAGTIGVSSKPGEGSTFWIELPAGSAASATGAREPAAAAVRIPEDAVARTILYIEDNPINLKLVQQILSRHGYLRLLTAHTGELGLSVARSQTPDLILLDMNLPGMDGYAVLAALKSLRETADIPVVVLSANAIPGDVARARAAGVRYYLTKPFNLAEFLTAVNNILGVAAA